MSTQPPSDDWRRQGQEQYLTGACLRKARYVPPREDWDHDHCEFCFAKFMPVGDALSEGFCTEDEYRWICPTCFADFREEFGWTVSSDAGSSAD